MGKGITILVAVDDNMGMMFNQRRQSMDRILRQKILKLTQGHRLWMNGYSASQFHEDEKNNIVIDENFLQNACFPDYCFVEHGLPDEQDVNRIILFRWNQSYPSDVSFTYPLKSWRKIEAEDFQGYSHRNITMEVYVR